MCISALQSSVMSPSDIEMHLSNIYIFDREQKIYTTPAISLNQNEYFKTEGAAG